MRHLRYPVVMTCFDTRGMSKNGVSEVNQIGSGVRTVQDLGFDEVDVLAEDGEPADLLEPGDILLCRGTNNWLSDLISSLDGFWTHSAVYGGDGLVVHAYTAGVGTIGIADFLARYPGGVGVARPAFSAAERAEAAEFARTLAALDGTDDEARYSGWDLGVAYALLRRARERGAPVLRGGDGLEFLDWLPWCGDDVEYFAATCSGMVYRCYSDGADYPLSITPAPGLAVEDQMLIFPNNKDLYSAAAEAAVIDEKLASDLERIGRPDLGHWRDRFLLVGGALAGWAFFASDDKRSVPLVKGVTPSDLWCSPDIAQRWFVTREHAEIARRALIREA